MRKNANFAQLSRPSPPISGLSNTNMIQFFGKNEQIPFYKVITEIGSLAARISQASQGRISKRADPSK